MSKSIEKKMPRKRLHSQQISGATIRPGYARRIVNDEPGRVEMFEAAGWAIVRDNKQQTLLHDKNAATVSQPGTVCSKVVNKRPLAPCTHGVLMEIKQEYYNEDLMDKCKVRAHKMEQLDPKKYKQNGSDYGYMSYN